MKKFIIVLYKKGVCMLSKKIYELRKKINVSQEGFAMAINTSRQSASKWELGDSYPKVNKLKDIASFFNVQLIIYWIMI